MHHQAGGFMAEWYNARVGGPRFKSWDWRALVQVLRLEGPGSSPETGGPGSSPETGGPRFKSWDWRAQVQVLRLEGPGSSPETGGPRFKSWDWRAQVQVLRLEGPGSSPETGGPRFKSWDWRAQVQVLRLQTFWRPRFKSWNYRLSGQVTNACVTLVTEQQYIIGYNIYGGWGWDTVCIDATQSHSGEHLVAMKAVYMQSWNMFTKI